MITIYVIFNLFYILAALALAGSVIIWALR